MLSSTSTIVNDCVVAMAAGITGATNAVSCRREIQATLSTSHAGAQCNLQSFEDMGYQTADFPGTQCCLQSFEDMGCQMHEDWAGAALNPFHLSSRQKAPCGVHDHKCCPLPSNRRSANDHQECRISEGPYVSQSCKQQSHDGTYKIALERELCGELPYMCPICKKVFIQENNFTTHMTVHGVRKSYGCQFCPKTYTDSHALLVHEKRHTGRKPFICSTCDRGFSSKACLEIHERMHGVSKPFGCQLCSQCFASQDSLGLHLSQHNTARVFFCAFCQRGWPTQQALAVHESWHAREKPNVCHICERRFSRQADLRRHVQLHRGNRRFTCDTCHRGFWDKNDLLKHLRGKTHAELYAKKFIPKKQSFPLQMADQ